MMERSRRSFLKIAGLSAIALGSRPVLKALATSDEHGGTAAAQVQKNKDALTAKRWGMVVDSRKITSPEDLEPMIKVCDKLHNIPQMQNKDHEIKWIWEEDFEHAFPTMEDEFLSDHAKHTEFPVLCNHCKNPPCVRACPTKATFKREDGIVMMDYHRCIGCRFCMAACPFGARSFNFRDPRPFITEKSLDYPTRCMGVVEKCNFCAERLAVGKMPACVEASNGILTFGDLDDPNSNVRALLKSNFTIRRKESLGTEPSVYYIL
jgi:[DsrC]-trisulfide reductase subunit O